MFDWFDIAMDCDVMCSVLTNIDCADVILIFNSISFTISALISISLFVCRATQVSLKPSNHGRNIIQQDQAQGHCDPRYGTGCQRFAGEF